MKNTTLISILFFYILFVGCGGCGDLCPPDIMVGELDLHEDTKAWMPYDGTDTLTFINQNGDEFSVIAINGKEEPIDKTCTKHICTEPDEFNPTSSCEYYDTEAIRFTFSNIDNFVSDILYHSEVVGADVEEFYQALQVSVSYGETKFGMGQLITKTIPEQTIFPSQIGHTNPFILLQTVTLNGNEYKEVLKSESPSLTIYFSKEQGLVGFESDTEIWNLK